MDYNQGLGKHLITEEILTVPTAVLQCSNINLLQFVMSRITQMKPHFSLSGRSRLGGGVVY